MSRFFLSLLILFVTSSSQAAIVPSSGFAKNVLNCMFPGGFSILYYTYNGMITYADESTLTIVGGAGEAVISLNGTVKPFGLPGETKNFVVLDGSYNEVLRVEYISTGFNAVENLIVSHYSAIYKYQSGQCILLQEGPLSLESE